MNRITVMRAKYPNYGKPWYRRDILSLEICVEKKMPLEDICDTLGRNPSAIVRNMVMAGVLRKGNRGEVLRYSEQAMDWRVWAIVRKDVIITDGFRTKQEEYVEPEGATRLRAQFERNFAIHNPQVSLKRDPFSPGT